MATTGQTASRPAKGTLIDISPLVAPDIVVWPGDVPYQATKSLEIAKGANIDLGSMHTTYHVGAHADAPNHYVKGGKDAASMPLEPFYGECQVVTVSIGKGTRIRPSDVKTKITARRVLFKTATFGDHRRWNRDFASLSAELVEWLGTQGVRLVGIDTPSVDLQDDKVLESHQALAKNGMYNLEGLVLDKVADGTYTLIALPLPLKGADASPVRAVLVTH